MRKNSATPGSSLLLLARYVSNLLLTMSRSRCSLVDEKTKLVIP